MFFDIFLWAQEIDSDVYCQALKESYHLNLYCQKKGLFQGNRLLIPQDKEVFSPIRLMDIFTPMYPYEPIVASADGGRNRPYLLFKACYGKNKEQIIKNLKVLIFFGTKVEFNIKNSAFFQLKAVKKDLKLLIQYEKKLKKYLLKASTFNYRNIRGTNDLSAHSFGIAIDLNPQLNHCYWLYHHQARELKDFPEQIVAIFEKHGFIWGGKWKHYDEMHFEYRPEFLQYQKLITQRSKDFFS